MGKNSHLDHASGAGAGRGLCAGQGAGSHAGQGPARPGGGLRADGCWRGAVALAGRRGPRPHPLRGAAAPRWRLQQALEQRGGHGPGGGLVGRGRRGQVAPGLRVGPLPPHPGLAGAGERLGVLWQGDPLFPGHRPAQALLPDRGPRRPPHHPREGDRAAADAGRALQETLPALLALLDALPEDSPSWHARSARSGASARSTRSSACCCAKARCSRCCWCSRICTGSTPRPRRCSTAWWRACPRPGSCCWSTTARSTSTAGAARPTTRQLRLDPLPPASADAFCRPCWATIPAWQPLKQLLIDPHRGQPVLPGRERAHAGGDRGAGRRAGCLSAGAGRCRACRCRPRCRRCWRRASTGCRRRRSACSRPPRSSARRCPCRCCRPLPSCPRRRCTAAWRTCRPPSSSTRRSLFPEREYTFKHALTHEVAYGRLLQERRRVLHARIVEALEAPRAATGWPSRSNAWRTMPCGARCGTRPSPTAGRRGRRPWRARPTARPWGTSSRRSAALAHLPETRDTREQAIDLRLALRSALLPSGDFGRILA